MYKVWRNWLAFNASELTTMALVVVCLACLGMLLRWSL